MMVCRSGALGGDHQMNSGGDEPRNRSLCKSPGAEFQIAFFL
jgi:hypothetical protein